MGDKITILRSGRRSGKTLEFINKLCNDMDDKELKGAVNKAYFYLKVHGMQMLGKIQSDGIIPIDKCAYWIERGKKRGIKPDKSYVDPDFKLDIKIQDGDM